MSLPLKLNFSDYDNFLTDPNYTTSAEAQDYFRNMDMLVEALIEVGLWQPETNYPNGHVVFSPNMPNGTEAVCVAANGGKSSNTEPSWGEVGGENISDGTCFWKLRWKHWSKENATNRLPNATYAVGNVMLHKSNLSVALKCTTAGTTSNTELDISTVSVGESVEDGSVVWSVVSRDTVATIDKERPIKTFTSLEQLGLPNTCTPEDIAMALPNYSMMVLGINGNGTNANNPNLGINEDGLLTAKKHNGSGYVDFYFNNQTGSYRANYSNWLNLKFSGWEKIITSNEDYVITSFVNIKVVGKRGASASLTAPNINGYKFICWVNTATSGWIASTYVANLTAQNTKLWVGANNDDLDYEVDVHCWALYRKE